MNIRDTLPDVPRCRFMEIEGKITGKGAGRVADAHATAGNRTEITVGSGQERWYVNTGVYLHKDDVVKILREYAARCAARADDITKIDSYRLEARRLADDYGAMADFFEWQGR